MKHYRRDIISIKIISTKTTRKLGALSAEFYELEQRYINYLKAIGYKVKIETSPEIIDEDEIIEYDM
jgi:hypothetical protein